MPVDLPLTDDAQSPNTHPDFSVNVVLDGATYQIRARWVTRAVRNGGVAGAWFVRVLDEIGQAVILADVKMVADWTLYLYRARGAIVLTPIPPPGLLLVDDTSGVGLDPDFGDLGGRIKLRYVAHAEVVAIATAA